MIITIKLTQIYYLYLLYCIVCFVYQCVYLFQTGHNSYQSNWHLSHWPRNGSHWLMTGNYYITVFCFHCFAFQTFQFFLRRINCKMGPQLTNMYWCVWYYCVSLIANYCILTKLAICTSCINNTMIGNCNILIARLYCLHCQCLKD